jgi:hypothetical protein
MSARKRKIIHAAIHLSRSGGGNFGLISALLLPMLLVVVGGAVDMSHAFAEKTRLQDMVDSAVLSAASKSTDDERFKAAKAMLAQAVEQDKDVDFQSLMDLAVNADGSLTGTFNRPFQTNFLRLIGMDTLDISVTATAISGKGEPVDNGCIYVLGSRGQDVLINSGAKVYSKACTVNVHSKAAPAFIMNAGSTIDTAKFCVRGTNYIKNGGTLTNLEAGCIPANDPYAGQLPTPTVASTCSTSGWKDGGTHSLKPGVHCETGFNGSPTITFEPGLHIIKGRMIINSNATVVAEGVTFYFPDVNSEIRINGGVSFKGTAPTTGPYKGILMFENTANSANNANKQQYIFNGSKGEILEGIIYLPNRDVTYNSTTNQVNRISLVVNSMIVNSANWLMEPYEGSGSGTGSAAFVRLIN